MSLVTNVWVEKHICEHLLHYWPHISAKCWHVPSEFITPELCNHKYKWFCQCRYVTSISLPLHSLSLTKEFLVVQRRAAKSSGRKRRKRWKKVFPVNPRILLLLAVMLGGGMLKGRLDVLFCFVVSCFIDTLSNTLWKLTVFFQLTALALKMERFQ